MAKQQSCTKKPTAVNVHKEASKAVVTPRAKPSQTKAAVLPLKGAIATPGDSAKKIKKKTKGIATLDSFFGKGKKKDVATKPLVKVGCKSGKTEGDTGNKAAVETKKGEEKVETSAKGAPKKKVERKTVSKPSVLESVGAEESAVETENQKIIKDSPKLEAGKSEKAAAANSKVDLDETNDAIMKGTSPSEPDDDDTVDLEEENIPPPSYDSCSEASEEPIEEVAVKAVEVESPLSKSSEEGSKDVAMLDASKQADLFAGVPSKTGEMVESSDEKQTMPVDAESDESKSIQKNASNEESRDVNMADASKSADASVPSNSVEVVNLTDEEELSPSTDAKPDTSKKSKKAASEAKPNKTSKSTGPSSKKETPKNSTAAKGALTKTAAAKTEPKPVPLSEENAARMKKYTNLRERYVTRAVEVASRSTSDEFVRESLSHEELALLNKGSVEVAEDGGFPDELLPRLLILVQGRCDNLFLRSFPEQHYIISLTNSLAFITSNLPLSALSKSAQDSLSEFISDARSLSLESISSKVKLLAQRKPYLSGSPPSPSKKPTPLAKLDCFEDVSECYFWRWELSSIDLLPQKEATKVKKARTTRKKLQSHHAAIFKLISTIDNATKWLQNNPTSSEPSPSVPILAKVSDMEEKVLKFEREEEKARLLKEAKASQAKNKAEEQAAKQKEKERVEQERLAAKKLKDEQKAAAAKEREEAKLEAKRKKEAEKLQQQREAEEKEAKQKKRMMSFFSAGTAKKKPKTQDTAATTPAVKEAPSSFDSDAFRSMINSKDSHVAASFSKRKQQKTGEVKVSVHVTVVSENPFGPQPYDEEKIISVPNKYKFLGFHEDHRPPYHGTWSKRSSLVTGRRPLNKDTEYLDYEIDSEAEWEEEDEEGEDCDKSDGEEEDMLEDDDNDSFLAAEDELGLDDEDDEETKKLRKKKILSEATISAKACVIAPRSGGLTHHMSPNAIESFIEGFIPQDAIDLLSSHAGRVLTPDVVICLDALPPIERDEKEPKPPASQKMSPESMKLMAQFVHNSTVKSKEKIVTELLNAHPNVASSRAQAMRELEVTADKRRLPNGGGVVWEVKADHLNLLGLTEKDLVSIHMESCYLLHNFDPT